MSPQRFLELQKIDYLINDWFYYKVFFGILPTIFAYQF